MSYQVLARKWRPQRFDDVVGQQAVTRTLRNAISSGRIAHAFVFAGSRGCGKTTTARILARALSCVKGPTADPCGECDACVEIAQGRDIDVLEIDAASHTGIDNIREVVIAGLAIAPVRNRYKVFIIDEVHQLSTASFNALLKSIEEPPAHVVFMMATTELHKIPDTILSRSQVFEFRTIHTTAIAGHLRKIADAEGIQIPDAALALLARSAEGSMRDAQSALDQVMAFAGNTISVDDVSTVLGLVGRDLLFDLLEAIVEEDAPGAFALADRAVEAGHDLRLLCRELARVVRDVMIVSVDPSRIDAGEIDETERGRLQQLAGRFSREDLLRAFDVLSAAEQDIRNAAQPRYYFEMMLLRWMHLRKLIPLADLMEQLERGAPTPPANTPTGPSRSAAPAKPVSAPVSRPATPVAPPPARPASSGQAGAPANLKDSLLAEIRSTKTFFYNTVVAQAQKIDVADDRVTFSFLPAHRALREQFEQARGWLEVMANRLAGRRITVVAVQSDAPAASPGQPPASAAALEENGTKRDLKAEALSSAAVQAMLEVFPAEIRDIEEM
jgi:DNA polymerase-3 subunit gamma/tau